MHVLSARTLTVLRHATRGDGWQESEQSVGTGKGASPSPSSPLPRVSLACASLRALVGADQFQKFGSRAGLLPGGDGRLVDTHMLHQIMTRCHHLEVVIEAVRLLPFVAATGKQQH